MHIRMALEVITAILVAGFALRELLGRATRHRLTLDDWFPRGWLGLLTICCFGLLYGGGWVLLGPHQSFRIGGAIALVGGVALLVAILRYLRRPVAPVAAAAGRHAKTADTPTSLDASS